MRSFEVSNGSRQDVNPIWNEMNGHRLWSERCSVEWFVHSFPIALMAFNMERRVKVIIQERV